MCCVVLRLTTPPGSTSPILFEQWCGFFYVPQEPDMCKCCETGPGFSSLSEKSRKSNHLQISLSFITKTALSSQFFKDPECWFGRGSNPRPIAQQTGALPTELTRSRSTWTERGRENRLRTRLEHFCLDCHIYKCRRQAEKYGFEDLWIWELSHSHKMVCGLCLKTIKLFISTTWVEALYTYLHIGWCSLCRHQAANLIHCFCDRFAGVGDQAMFLAMNLDSRRILQRTLKQIGISLKTGGNIDIKKHLPVRLNYFLSTVQVESLFQFRQNLAQFSLKSTFEFMSRRSRSTMK